MKVTLKAARVNAGLTLCQVSEMIGISKSTLARLENGKTPISIDRLRKICALYKVKESEIIVPERSNAE